MELDILIAGGDVVDGTGSPRSRLDVGIVGGKIAAVDRIAGATAARVIDAKGRLKTYFSVRDYSEVGLKNIWIGDFRSLRGLPAGAPIGVVDGRPQSSVDIPP